MGREGGCCRAGIGIGRLVDDVTGSSAGWYLVDGRVVLRGVKMPPTDDLRGAMLAGGSVATLVAFWSRGLQPGVVVLHLLLL